MTALLLVSAMVVAQSPESAAGLDRSLAQEIAKWKKGDPPPRRLLKYPNGPALQPFCGWAFGPAVEDYVSGINDDELLKALLFDARADDACIDAASWKLIQSRGVKGLRAILAERRKSNPGDFNHKGLATLTQLLASPYIRLRAASLGKKDALKTRP